METSAAEQLIDQWLQAHSISFRRVDSRFGNRQEFGGAAVSFLIGRGGGRGIAVRLIERETTAIDALDVRVLESQGFRVLLASRDNPIAALEDYFG